MLAVSSNGVTSTLSECNDRTSVSCAGSRFRLDSVDDKDAYANSLVIFLVYIPGSTMYFYLTSFIMHAT